MDEKRAQDRIELGRGLRKQLRPFLAGAPLHLVNQYVGERQASRYLGLRKGDKKRGQVRYPWGQEKGTGQKGTRKGDRSDILD